MNLIYGYYLSLQVAFCWYF